MSDVTQDLIAFLRSDASVQKIAANRVADDHVAQVKHGIDPYIWISLRQTQNFETLDGAVGEEPMAVRFDLECVAMRQRDSKDLAAAVRSKLHNYRGSFGGRTVKGVFVTDQNSDYVPVNEGGDRGMFVTAYDIEVLP